MDAVTAGVPVRVLDPVGVPDFVKLAAAVPVRVTDTAAVRVRV